jgi:murein L,D-transpeptidase YcbB/YkuD
MAPALAQIDPSDIAAALAQPEISVGDIILARDDLGAFYKARDNQPAWNFAGADNAVAFKGFLDSLQKLIEYHGLPAEDYPLDDMKALAAQDSSPGGESGVKLELLVTDTLLHLAHALHGDVIDLGDLYPGWTFRRADIDIPATLAAAVAGNGLEAYIAGLAPKNPAYAKLAEALKTYRAIAAQGGWPPVEPGPMLFPKDHGPRVAQLRARLAVEGYLTLESLPKGKAAQAREEKRRAVYDNALHDAVIAYQARNGLAADGHVGDKTVAAMDIPVEARIGQIIANMERWRHMPDDFPPDRYILVNIPDASVDVVENGASVYRGPVIVGKVDRKTPFIQSAIRSMIFNPSWHVPKKIAQKDILPKLRADPHYLEKLGFVIKGSENDPYGEHIDWKSLPEQEFNFRLRQEPGNQNSLGRLKFDFDNDFAVYMHGTPHQELFAKNVRDLSSGCVRLRDPEQVAAILLAGNKDAWPTDRIEAEIASKQTHWVGFAKPMPIFFLYWTVFADHNGAINFRDDIYNYDGFLIENMNAYTKGEPPPPPLDPPPKTP